MATDKTVLIAAPNFQTAVFLIRGTAPYVQNKFSQKAREMMRLTQEGGSTRKKGAKRDAKNFKETYEQAKHIASDGWIGIPAPSFRNAMISACRVVGFKMTVAKLSVFIEPDGFDADDGTPLVRILSGEPRVHEGLVRNSTGVADIRWRPMWESWSAQLRVKFDADQFTLQDVTNLLSRSGIQVGVGEGRPDSKASAGMGWGTFEIVNS